MKENIRLFFSILWLVATGCVLASVFLIIFTWGGHLNYLYISLAVWAVATAGAIITAL